MKKLEEVAGGRDNNFNLIRAVAASAVLLPHSFTLALGPGISDPVGKTLGINLGSLAVDTFFVISGFLLASSLFQKQDIARFALARVLRIFPALLLVMLLSVFLLGSAMTSLPLGEYLRHPQTWQYLRKGATLVFGVDYSLPGVFETTPLPSAVNGSLWSMPYELWMYLLLGAGWLVLSVFGPRERLQYARALVCFVAAVAGSYVIASYLIAGERPLFARLAFMFFSGAAFFSLKEKVRLSWRTAALLLLALCAARPDKSAFFVVYLLTVGYLLLCLAYLPTGRVRGYNKLGDYSYGMYIFAFPIQQTIVALNLGIGPWTLFVCSWLATLPFAIASWHLVERPATSLQRSPASITAARLARSQP